MILISVWDKSIINSTISGCNLISFYNYKDKSISIYYYYFERVYIIIFLLSSYKCLNK